MPPRNKVKSAPNQHDKRHESGLAPPGKRVVRKHSNGHLNGQPNGKPAPSVPSSPLPSAGLEQAYNPPHSADHPYPVETTHDDATAPEGTERDRAYSEVALEEVGQWAEMGESYREPVSTTTPPGEAPAPVQKKGACNPAGTASSVSTLLAYYPLRDAISLLILLLSLPPTLVLVIQTLFASLTFVPPTASVSLSTLPNIKEIFNSSNFGYPALATILIVDLIFWVCWLPVWKTAQNVFLDLSQAVIAISLSGAAAGSRGPTYSIATCTAIVCAVHVLRYKAIHLTALDYLRSVLHKADIDISVDVPSFFTNLVSPPLAERGWLYTVIRTILGIHIVSQGVTTCVRRSLVKANEQSANVPAVTRSEHEAASASEPAARSNSVSTDGAPHPSAAQATDGRPPGPSPAHRDNRSRESAQKKKRKQANQVRSQQPLWAAIASTKVTFVKEMEQREAFDDAREAARGEPSSFVSSHSTNAYNRIWICAIRDTGLFFNVELSAEAALVNTEEGARSSARSDEKSPFYVPFYVRINGATWSSTRIKSSADNSSASHCQRFDGEIFGLAPLSSYSCEIVSLASQEILCSTSIITQPASSDEQAASMPAQAPHPALRPSSPTTTLKQSIQQAEAKLHETRNRSRKTKKDQRALHSDVKREINTLRNKLETSGGTDDKQKSRLTQISQHKSQAEEATADLKKQIEDLGEIPAAELASSEDKRKKWQAASDARSMANKDLDRAKADADRDSSHIKLEISQAESKQEKLNTRLAQRTQELEGLVSKQQAETTAKQKRETERAQTIQRREDEESQLKYHISSFDTEVQRYQQKAQDAYQEILALQSWSTSTQPQAYQSYSAPATPDDAFPVANGGGVLPSPQTNGFPKFNPSQSLQNAHHSVQTSISNPQGAAAAPRGRSSSMLSQYSGFTDNGEEYSFAPTEVSSRPPLAPHAPPYGWPVDGHALAGAADGSGSVSLASGSTGSNSPRPDARVFAPVKAIAPLGRSKEKPQSPTMQSSGSGR